MSLPPVQTIVAHYVTEKLNENFKTDINVEKVAISVFGGVKLKKVLIKDHHKDTLIYANRIKTNIPNLISLSRIEDITRGNLIFGTLRIDGLFFNLKTYKKEDESNINLFVDLFDNGKPPSKNPFVLKAQHIYLTKSRFSVINENLVTPKSLDLKKINAELSDFKIINSDINSNIDKLSLLDHRGLFVQNLKTKISLTKKSILLEELDIVTRNSKLVGKVSLNYEERGLADFTNKVNLDVQLDTASVSTTDLNYFYNEFGKKQRFTIKTHINGTLNDLFLKELDLVDNNNSVIKGELNFKNLFRSDNDPFYMKGDIKELSSNYPSLKIILPRILGKKLPIILEKIGRFNIIGLIEMTKSTLDVNVAMNSDIGNLSTKLGMTNINAIENATYKGNIVVDKFNIGKILNKKDLGLINLNLDVDGIGFSEKHVNTTIKGNIESLIFKNYSYKNINISGKLKKPYFEGLIDINDTNLKMSFNGLVDLSKKDKNYDFHLQVDYADLHTLNLIEKDSIAIFKGDLKIKTAGNTFEDLYGTLNFSKTSYQKNNNHYYFDDFTIESIFDENRIRTISINSPDIIEGKIIGKYKYNELSKLFENALGSLYTNYSPYKVSSGQSLRFNFTIYNKIIEIFYPEISLGNNTYIRGYVNADKGDFKFNFNAPTIEAFQNYFTNIKVNIDNKNPLYNAYVEMDSLRTTKYKISDFSLINITQNDTLFVRTEFKGGNKADDYFKLNLYHTINQDNKSVVGFKKSEINFKDFIWFLNEKEENNNKIVFNKSLTDISVDKITMSHENQSVELLGVLKDSTYKDLNLSFKNIDVLKITPTIDSLYIEGELNGDINFKQNKHIYQPISSISIDGLTVNKVLLGDFRSEIKGDESLSKFNINSYLINNNFEAFSAKGNLQIVDKQTLLSLDLKLDQFNLAAFAPLGGNIISNIRGVATGRVSLEGKLKDPEINGRIYLENTGMRIPYLNVDYAFDNNAMIDLTNQQLLFRNITMTDTKYNTEGKLNGNIRHINFKNWQLNLAFSSSNMVVLDTKDSDDAVYYGTAFIKGDATLKGPTNALAINVNAKSQKNTFIKIPVNNSESTGNSTFLHFLTRREKYNLQKGIQQEDKDYGGLELSFNLDITPDAEIEILLDKNTGHGIRGKGFGTILLDINTTGKFQMYGNFQAYQGYYNFNYGGLINKRFEVKSGGYINWEGDPLRALLNIEAIYKTEANPAVLLDNPSFNRKTPVEVVIALTGNLSSPEPDFNINFPSVSSVLKSEIQYKLDDKDTRQTQALYLLSTGSFLSSDNAGNGVLAGNLFEKASSMFNDLFDDKNGKFKVGVNYVQGTKIPGFETEGRFGFTVSTQINEKISINGKLGVPVGGAEESVVVGDVEVLLRLNEDKTLNARVFNKENDINYIGEGIGYTQGIGITYQTDFDTFKELIRKILNKASKDKEDKETNKTTTTDIPDSDLPPDFIKLIEKRSSRKTIRNNPKMNIENVPEID